MEITPIAGIRALPAVRQRKANFRLEEVFELEGAAKPGEGSVRRAERKAAGAEEDDEPAVMAESADDEDAVPRQVDFFA